MVTVLLLFEKNVNKTEKNSDRLFCDLIFIPSNLCKKILYCQVNLPKLDMPKLSGMWATKEIIKNLKVFNADRLEIYMD